MQYMRHRVQAPITIGDFPPGLPPPLELRPSDDTHELGDDESLSSWTPSTSIPTGGDRFSCSSGRVLLTPPPPPPRLMAHVQHLYTNSSSETLSNLPHNLYNISKHEQEQRTDVSYLKQAWRMDGCQERRGGNRKGDEL